jgi:hypothetical protein
MPSRPPAVCATPARTSVRRRRAPGAALIVVLAAAGLAAGCTDRTPTGGTVLDGLIVLAAEPDGTTLTGWDAAGDGQPIDLPDGATVWVAAGRADVLAATLASGEIYTSDPVRLGDPLDWRLVKAVDPTGNAPAGPAYFATWDPEGGRFAALAGDLTSGEGVRLVLEDPSVGTAFEIDLGRSVVAAPPAWIGDDRLVVVTGDSAAPTSAIIDTTTGSISDGPAGARVVATSPNGRRIATMAGQGEPVVIRDTAAWLAGDGTAVGSVDPPSGATTAVAFALDASGERLAIAWATDDGAIRLAIHDGRSDWRRTAEPDIGAASGAMVAWRR